MRILVTGSRDWSDPHFVWSKLSGSLVRICRGGPMVRWTESLTVIHGDCPHGADAAAKAWVERREAAGAPIDHEPYPADWDRLGHRAGPIRNAEMVAAGADVCLAFIKGRSKGATHCARLALEAGIETHVWTAS